MRAFADHVDDYQRVHTIELHQDGYGGSALKLKGDAQKGFFSFEHQKIDPREPWGIQMGILDLHVWVRQDDSSLLDDVLSAGERDFWLIHKIDDVEQWRGYVLPDLCSYIDDEVISFTITAKDFTTLKGDNFSILPSGRFTAISLLADMLDYLGFDKDIITATSWKYDELTGDFLRQVYNNREVFSIPREAGQAPAEISVLDALEVFTRNYGLVLKQAKGAFYADQLTAYADATDVTRAVYDSDGDLQSESAVDTTSSINRTDRRITLGSVNAGNPGIKRATALFEHRTTVRNISWPPSELFLTGEFPTIRSQFFQSDGNQRLQLEGEIWARFEEDSGHTEASSVAQITFSNVGATVNFRWNGEEWVESGTPISLNIPLPRLSTGDQYRGSFLFFTDVLPVQTGTLSILITKPISDGVPDEPDRTEFSDFNLEIRNPSIEEGDNTSIGFSLTQSGNFSVIYDHGTTWIGDGPTSYAISAITLDEAGTQLTGNQWGRVTTDQGFHETLLKEFIDFQRSFRRSISAILKGPYTPSDTIDYDNEEFYYLGGSLDGMTGNWSADFVMIDIQTGTDVLELDYSTSPVSGIGGGIGGGTGGGGVAQTWDTLSGKPFSTIGDNLTVVSGALTTVSVPNFQGLEIDGNPFVDSSRNVTANRYRAENGSDSNVAYGFNDTTGIYRTAGGNLGIARDGVAIINVLSDRFQPSTAIDGTIDIGSSSARYRDLRLSRDVFARDVDGRNATYTGDLQADTLRTDSGKFLSPVDYQFRNAGDTSFRNVQMAGLTATTGTFSNIVSITRTVASFVDFTRSGQQWSMGVLVDGEFRIRDVTGGESLFVLDKDGGLRLGEYGSIDGRVIFNGQALATVDWQMGATGESFEFGTTSGATSRDFLWGFSGDAGINLIHTGFSSGFTGSNWQITHDGQMAGDSLFLRGTLTVNELVFNRIHAVDGEMIISPGRGKIESVSGSTLTLYDPSDTGVTSFAVNDIVIVQRINPDLQTIVKRLVRRVSAVDNDNSTITVTTSGIDNPTSVGSFAEGDVVVVIGNTTNTARQSSIVLSASSADSNNPPYQRFLEGVDSWSAWTSSDKISAQIGNLSGIPAADSNFGLYARQFDFIAGDDFWRTSDGTGSLGDGVLTWDGVAGEVTAAGWSFTSNDLRSPNDRIIFRSIPIGTTVAAFRNANPDSVAIYMSGAGNPRVDVLGPGGADDYVTMISAGASDWGIEGVTGGDMVFSLGSDNMIAGWGFNETDIFSATSGTRVGMSVDGLTGAPSGTSRGFGFSVFRPDGDVSDNQNSFKSFKAGRIPNTGTTGAWSNNSWGVQIWKGSVSAGTEVFRVDESGAFIDALDLRDLSVSGTLTVSGSLTASDGGTPLFTISEAAGIELNVESRPFRFIDDNSTLVGEFSTTGTVFDLSPGSGYQLHLTDVERFGQTIVSDTVSTDLSTWNPGNGSIIEVENLTSGTVNISSLVGESAGRWRVVYNLGSTGTVNLVTEAGSGTASQRFRVGKSISPGDSAIMYYSSNFSRWVVIN